MFLTSLAIQVLLTGSLVNAARHRKPVWDRKNGGADARPIVMIESLGERGVAPGDGGYYQPPDVISLVSSLFTLGSLAFLTNGGC